MASNARRILLVLVLVGALTLAGCTLEGGQSDSEYPSESDVRGKLSSLDSLQSDVLTETEVEGNVTTERMSLLRDFDRNGYRAETVSGPAEGTTIVSNGSRMWYYEPQTNTVRVIEQGVENQSLDRSVETISSIFAQLRDDGSESGSVGISPSPTVPLDPSSSNPTDGDIELPMGENVTATDEGTEAVDGRDAWKVDLEVNDGASLVENATYWIDTEWYFPIKATVTVDFGNQTTVATSTYRNVTFNEPLDAAQFTYDPPPTASVAEGVRGSLRVFQNRSELVSETDIQIPDPEIPEGYVFEQGRISPAGEHDRLNMVYTSEEGVLAVTKLVGNESTLSDGEPIDVGGRPARQSEREGRYGIQWTCSGDTYSVSGVSEETVRAVAASIDCE